MVKKVLGQGGMGAALLATDIRLDGKSVVIKELVSEYADADKQQDEVRNFKREVAMLAHLSHPLIPAVTDHFQEDSRYFMVQEYVEGENLEERLLRSQQPLKERDALICAVEILDVLEYLSQQTPPIVHRDIKPANIIIGTRDRRAYLVDFGIARAQMAQNTPHKQTMALGTPGYAPPEQYQGNADPRSDLYGLAATLHHVLTNRDPRNYPPFNYPPVCTLNPQLSPETEQVLARALMNDSNQRYQSATAMRQEIEAILRNRYGVSGNISTYMVGSSGPISQLPDMPTLSSFGQPVAYPIVQNTPSALSAPTLAGGSSPMYPPPNYHSSGLYPPPPPLATPQTMLAPPPQKKGIGMKLLLILVAVVVILLAAASFATIRGLQNSPAAQTTPTPSANTMPPLIIKGNETIGISNGSFAFDTTRPSGAAKKQATERFKQDPNDVSTVSSLLGQAISLDSGDAEALIYQEDLRVVNSGQPYVTFVVATMLSGSNSTLSVGRDSLQGAYVAQKEFNDGSKLHGGVQVRLLVANSGSQRAYAPLVAQQIVQLAKRDSTLMGVLGWPFSGHTLDVIHIFSAAHIPLLSQTASDDGLTNISSYFFRVAPPNKTQGVEGARYALQTLKTKSVALFVDPQNPYSQSLANDFAAAYQSGGGTVLRENYTVDKPGTIPDRLQDALSHNSDLIYFAGYASDISTLLTNLPSTSTIPVLGGDALYELGGYATSSRAALSHLSFTSFAYPDEWDVLGHGKQKPSFFAEYSANFDPNGIHMKSGSSPYGYDRADGDTILSYDGMVALLKGYNNALNTGKQKVTSDDLLQGLRQLSGTNGFQGVSGYIAFDNQGNPVDKAIVILFVVQGGLFQMKPTTLGHFLQ
ncbi:MAG TPA: bifunctional serine/threonine-protein kinase/ABC transporter substrate-binding protein [Ktedonobacteraceae bacterium]|nr:bifunctional serine/threonine-protein kinase/ABC transporter substrate-binding protein [Ktedonobacteraceae bacterium]